MACDSFQPLLLGHQPSYHHRPDQAVAVASSTRHFFTTNFDTNIVLTCAARESGGWYTVCRTRRTTPPPRARMGWISQPIFSGAQGGTHNGDAAALGTRPFHHGRRIARSAFCTLLPVIPVVEMKRSFEGRAKVCVFMHACVLYGIQSVLANLFVSIEDDSTST